MGWSVCESRTAFHGTPCSWARLLAKVYEGDALRCSRCGSPMRVLAVVTDPSEVRRTLPHTGRPARSHTSGRVPMFSDAPPNCEMRRMDYG